MVGKIKVVIIGFVERVVFCCSRAHSKPHTHRKMLFAPDQRDTAAAVCCKSTL